MPPAAQSAARLSVCVLIVSALFISSFARSQTLQIATDQASEKAFVASLVELASARNASQFEVTGASTALAFKKAATGEVDLAGTARPARRDDRQERQVDVFPVVWDALVVIVHPSNPIVNIQLQQLADVYTGQLTRWDQMGGEQVAIEILAHESALNGIAYNLAELILREPGSRGFATRRLASTEEIIAAVEANPQALAVVNYSAARKRRLKLLTLEGVAPAISNIRSGEYLLYFPMYLAVRSDAVNRRDIREFLRHATHSANRRILRRNGVLPYAEGLGLASRQVERARLLNGLKSRQ
ncbi:MAG: substrate-binding domain-containing protein [Lysobacterales bacterium]